MTGLHPIQTANLNAIKAKGRSDIFLKLEIIKKVVGLILVIATMNISVLAIGLSGIVYTVFVSIVNAFPNKKLLNYSYLEQIRDIMPSFLLSAVMGVVVYILPLPSGLHNVFRLFIQVIVGIIVYVAGAFFFKFEAGLYAKDTVNKFLNRS